MLFAWYLPVQELNTKLLQRQLDTYLASPGPQRWQKHQFHHNFFSQATKGHTSATFPNDTHTDSRSQRDAELTCGLFPSVNAASTKLTNIDRVLPVLQHFGDDEYVNICPVLPVPVLEGKRDTVTTNLPQQQQTFSGRRALGHCKMQIAHLGCSSSHIRACS